MSDPSIRQTKNSEITLAFTDTGDLKIFNLILGVSIFQDDLIEEAEPDRKCSRDYSTCFYFTHSEYDDLFIST